MREFDKVPLSYDEQIDHLIKKGLQIDDRERAKRHLSNISYYRLSAYMLPYKNLQSKRFKSGVVWENIYDLYVFDRKLRLLVFDAIERIEISLRNQIVYQLCCKYGSHWQDNKDIFSISEKERSDGSKIQVDFYDELQSHIAQQLSNKRPEEFINHYRNTYNKPKNPPAWMCSETMYFNHLSKICSALKKTSDIKAISYYYHLPPNEFLSWLHTLNHVRNICAHHSRLWNRDLSIVPKKLKYSKKLIWINDPDKVQRKKVYYLFCMINYFLQVVNRTSRFKSRLKALLKDYSHVISLQSMGFPDCWDREEMWKD